MLYIRHGAWFRWGSTFFLLVFVCSHVVPLLQERLGTSSRAEEMNLKVQSEGGLFGHNSIGIEEASLTSSDANRFLHFSTLGQWDFQRNRQTLCPAPIRALSGQKMSSVGFMYPLESGDKVKTFCLLRSTQTCCYGPRPQFNQYILVEARSPVPFERLTPILAHGTFYVDPKPDDGYIYRMEADAVRVVEEDTPGTDPVMAAKRAKLPLFDFALLVGMAKARTLPPTLNTLNGRRVVLSGYVVKHRRGNPAPLLVGKSWWDGVAQGEPPTLFNSVVVLPADAQQVPPLWKPLQTFTGTLQVNSDPAVWRHEGIVQFRNAQWGVPGVMSMHRVHTSPFVPWEIEVLLLGIILIRSVGWHTRMD